MTAIIQKLYASRARFHAKASQIKQFVHHHQIEGDLRKRIESWFISYWSVSKGVNTEEVSVSKTMQSGVQNNCSQISLAYSRMRETGSNFS